MRFRLGDENKPPLDGPDVINTEDLDHTIFDHISVSWGIDGNHDLRRGGNFTLQWSVYAEALDHSLRRKARMRCSRHFVTSRLEFRFITIC